MPIIVLGSRIQKIYVSPFFIECTHRQKIKLVTFLSLITISFFCDDNKTKLDFAIYFGIRDICPKIILGYLKN